MARTKQYSDKAIIAAIKARRGMVYLAAKKLGCSAETIYARAKTSPEVAQAIANERGQVVDTAEQKLFTAINKGEPWAIQLALKTLGKDRGYVERSEVDASVRMEVVEEVVDAPDGAENGTAVPPAGGVPPQ